MRRRTALATLAGAAAWWAGVVRAADPGGATPDAALIREGEAALVRGDAEAANAAFERAARMRHAAESEMGLVRAAMQGGRYAQALAFCAHTAGAHLDEAAAAGLYAWLLRVGGQRRIADDVLAQALDRVPDDAVLRTAHDALRSDWPIARGVLLEAPCRLAPNAWSIGGEAAPPRSARVVCSGVVVDTGASVLVPATIASTLRAHRAWVRDGLGATTTATLDGRDVGDPRIALLRLAVPLVNDVDVPAARDPFAGSPGFAVEFATDATGAPAWPLLWQGFVGGQADAGTRHLGIDLPPTGSGGGPVLDASGRVAGIVLASGEGRRFVPVSVWSRHVARTTSPEDAASSGPRRVLPLDEAYERSLRLAVQVLVDG